MHWHGDTNGVSTALSYLENENENENEVVLLKRLSVLMQLWDCIYHVLILTSLISHYRKNLMSLF